MTPRYRRNHKLDGISQVSVCKLTSLFVMTLRYLNFEQQLYYNYFLSANTYSINVYRVLNTGSAITYAMHFFVLKHHF